MAADDQLKDHQQMWSRFAKLLTWCTAGVVAVLIVMALALL